MILTLRRDPPIDFLMKKWYIPFVAFAHFATLAVTGHLEVLAKIPPCGVPLCFL